MEGPDKLVATAAYQPEPMAAAAARRFVRDTLQSWAATAAGIDGDGSGLVDDAVLLTSELVTNAVLHAGTAVHVTCRLADGNVEIVVRDSQPATLVPGPPGASRGDGERTNGWGLLLPSALASAWGVTYGRTAKAVWFRLGLAGAAAAQEETTEGLSEGDPAGPGALAAALRQALGAPASPSAQTVPGDGSPLPGEPSYQQLLQQTAASARAAVAADAACVVLADEDGELRLRAAAGAVPAGTTPTVITVPFVVDGRVTGLLAATKAQPGSFRDWEAGRLQDLADRSGPALERARLADLDRIRRERISALAIGRDLLAGGDMDPDKVMALAGEAVVPRLAAWCAVLLQGTDGKLRPAYVRHLDESRVLALGWVLERVCTGSGLRGQRLPRASAWPRAAWRLPLAAAVDADAAPAGTASLAGDAACCFPFPGPDGSVAVLVAGCRQSDRLPRDAAALLADLASRLGLALAGAARGAGHPAGLAQASQRQAGEHQAGQAQAGQAQDGQRQHGQRQRGRRQDAQADTGRHQASRSQASRSQARQR